MGKTDKIILVTGLSGFIGRRCIPFLLEKGYVVHGVDCVIPADLVGNDEIIWHELDLMCFDKTQKLINKIKPTHILNLAWYTEHGKFWKSPENLKWVQAGLNLLDAFAKVGGQRFVGAGSCAEYDWQYELLSESSTPLTAQTPFGRFKNALYEASMAFSSVSNFSFAWGRVFFVYGPGEPKTKLISSVIRSLLAGEVARCSSGLQKRDFIYVDDVARGFVSLLDNDITGAVNIASGQAVPLKQIIFEIANQLGRPDLLDLGAISSVKNDPLMLAADLKRFKTIEPAAFTDLGVGIRATIDFWKSKIILPKTEGVHFES